MFSFNRKDDLTGWVFHGWDPNSGEGTSENDGKAFENHQGAVTDRKRLSQWSRPVHSRSGSALEKQTGKCNFEGPPCRHPYPKQDHQHHEIGTQVHQGTLCHSDGGVMGLLPWGPGCELAEASSDSDFCQHRDTQSQGNCILNYGGKETQFLPFWNFNVFFLGFLWNC